MAMTMAMAAMEPKVIFEKIIYAQNLRLDQYWEKTVTDRIKCAPDFKEKHNLENVPSFPSLPDFVCCSELAYVSDISSDTYSNSKKQLAEMQKQGKMRDWMLLAIAEDDGFSNGYFGAAFYHSKNKHAVIAHRGTVLKTAKNKIQAFATDGFGILMGKNVSQISSAVTFTLTLLKVLNEILHDDQEKVHFEVCITGHSLGGWLAQITSFAAKYMYLNGTDITLVNNVNDGYHCHTVALESPGCSPKLLDLQRRAQGYRRHLDGEYNPNKLEFSVDILDITTYLTDPSLINNTKTFVGTLYLLPKVESQNQIIKDSWWTMIKRPFVNMVDTHSLINIKKCVEKLRSGQTKMSQAIDWPKAEFRLLSRRLIQFKGEKKIVDADETKCSKNILSQREYKFLFNYRYIRDTTFFISEFSVEEFVKDRLKAYDIDLMILSIKSNFTPINSFVPFVRLLLRLRPELYAKSIQLICMKEMKIEFYKVQSHSYLTDYVRNSSLNFIVDAATIDRYLEHPSQIIQLETSHPLVKVTEIYQTLVDTKQIPFHVFNINYLSMANGTVKLADLFESENEKFLILIECTTRDEIDYILLHKIFDDMSTMLETCKSVKVILVTFKNDIRMNNIVDYYLRQCNLHKPKQIPNDNYLWTKLDDQTRSDLKVSLINFQGHENVSVSELIGNESDESMYSAIFGKIDTQTLLSLSNKNLVIGMDQRLFINFEACCDTICYGISKKNLVALTLDAKNNKMFLIVGDVDTLINGLGDSDSKNLINAVIEERIQFTADQDPLREFQRICYDNTKKTVYLINRIEDDLINVQEIYSPEFYLRRHFAFRHKVVLTKNGVAFELTLSGCNAFVFSNISTIDELISLLDIKEDALIRSKYSEKLIRFATNLDEDIELDQRFRQTHHIHYIKVDGTDLIWHRSRGSLYLIRHSIDKEATKTAFLSEEELTRHNVPPVPHDLNKKIKTMIIVDEPGMGKSTSLNSLSTQLQSAWVIRVNLKNCSRAIATLDQDIVDTEMALNFFSIVDSVGLGSSLAKNLLALALDGRSSKRVYCLFDAFDEIRPVEMVQRPNFNLQEEQTALQYSITGKEKVIKLLKYLKSKKNIYVWITTRESGRDMLEDNLSVLSVRFERLSREQQVMFLTTHSQVRMDLEINSDLRVRKGHLEKAIKILQVAENIFGDISSFIGIPLQLKLLRSVQDSILEDFTAGEVYETFCALKFDIFLRDKMRMTGDAEMSLKPLCADTLSKYYSYFAFKLLFPGYATQFFDIDKKKIHILLNEMYRIGILQPVYSFDDYVFCHKTFAEFWISHAIHLWLKMAKNYRYPGLQRLEEFFIKEILLTKEHHVIRLFLNHRLTKEMMIEESYAATEIAQLWTKNEEIFFNDRKQSPLHLFAEEGLNALTEFILNINFHNPRNLYYKLDETSETAEMIADRKENKKIVELLNTAERKLFGLTEQTSIRVQ